MEQDKKKEILAQARPSFGWKENPLYQEQNRAWVKRSAEIALAIMDVLEEKNMTQTDLADKMEVSRQHISKILKGRENLTLETIVRLEEVLGCKLIAVLSQYESGKIDTPVSKASE